MKINREDMLELTRRMTSSRSHIMRLAGAYIDEEGYVDGTFNTNFLKLKGEERKRTLEIAKTIPFSRTNEELLAFPVSERKNSSGFRSFESATPRRLPNAIFEIAGAMPYSSRAYADTMPPFLMAFVIPA